MTSVQRSSRCSLSTLLSFSKYLQLLSSSPDTLYGISFSAVVYSLPTFKILVPMLVSHPEKSAFYPLFILQMTHRFAVLISIFISVHTFAFGSTTCSDVQCTADCLKALCVSRFSMRQDFESACIMRLHDNPDFYREYFCFITRLISETIALHVCPTMLIFRKVHRVFFILIKGS